MRPSAPRTEDAPAPGPTVTTRLLIEPAVNPPKNFSTDASLVASTTLVATASESAARPAPVRTSAAAVASLVDDEEARITLWPAEARACATVPKEQWTTQYDQYRLPISDPDHIDHHRTAYVNPVDHTVMQITT